MEIKPKVLIVDDNPVNVQVLTDSLDGMPYEVLIAMTGERAVKIIENIIPDVILLDINLPGMNGYEVCKKIKSNSFTSHIPVLFLSALNDAESKIEGFAVGGVDYISKPFNRNEVIARLETHLKIALLSNELKNNNLILLEAQQKLKDSNQMLLDSIIYAQRIQKAIFKTEQELQEFLPQSFILFRPQRHVSGDFYWFHERRNKIFVVVGDCTGHGVPGAMLSILAIQLFIRVVEERGILDPASVLNEVNFELKKILKQDASTFSIHDGMDVLALCIDLQNNQVKFASANRPLIWIKNDEINKIKGEKFPLGGSQINHGDFNNQSLEIGNNEMLYLTTDGFGDQFGGLHNRKFQSSKFHLLLQEIAPKPEQSQKEILSHHFTQWMGESDQTDDVLVMGIRL